MNKSELRHTIINKLNQLNADDQQARTDRLLDRLFNSHQWADASVIGLTMSQGTELSTTRIFKQGLQEHKQLVIPRTLPDHQMEFVNYAEVTEWTTKFGIQEPVDGNVKFPAEIELLIVPGLGFSLAGWRIGFGGGYYDRYLEDYSGMTISLALREQIIDNKLEHALRDRFDVPVQTILTEEEDD